MKSRSYKDQKPMFEAKTVTKIKVKVGQDHKKKPKNSTAQKSQKLFFIKVNG